MASSDNRRLLNGADHICFAYSKDGTRVFVGGGDATIVMLDMREGHGDGEPPSYSDWDEKVTCIDTCKDYMIAGSEDSTVRRFDKNTLEFLGNVTQTEAIGIFCLSIDPKGKKVAVGSQEPDHPSGVRKVSWHPTLPLLVACGCNGVITVWDLTDNTPHIVKKMDGIIPAVKDSQSPQFMQDCSVVWHPSGEHFFVITKSHEVITVSRSSWSKTSTFSDTQAVGTPTALAMSVNGVYLATVIASTVYVWSTETRRIISTRIIGVNKDKFVTQLAFSPTENLLSYADSEGWYGTLKSIIPASMPSPINSAPSTKHPRRCRRTEIPRSSDFDQADDTEMEEMWRDTENNRPQTPDHDIPQYSEPVSVTEPQPPFQPASTPMHLKKRYLAYNTLGVIEVSDQDTHHVVNIEMFDKSTRRGMHFNDPFKFDMGYLGERGALFACQPEGEHSAKVAYKPYGGWSAQSNWTYDLKRNDVRVLGFGNVVIATDEGDLTFLSGTGRERRIMGLGADFISMVASAEWVFVVYRAGPTTSDGSQNLSYSMINFDDFTVRQRDFLPVAKGHVLKWIGITEEGAPAMYDSSGRVHILTNHRIPHHATWARVMDTTLLERRQGKDESYWPVGITGGNFMCLILKGRQEYPEFPRPLIQELPITMPFRGEDPKEEELERGMLLRDLSLDALDEELTNDDIIDREKAMDKEFIKLIQNACKDDNVPRAIELTKLLHNTHALTAVIKIADFYSLVGFREKVERLSEIRTESEDRLILAREKRRQWNKPEAPPRRLPDVEDSISRAPKPFQDFGPPPPIARPGLSRARPGVESSKYTSKTTVAPPAAWEELDPPAEKSATTTPEGKRKRSPDVEDSPAQSMPPPKQSKPNPFARKQLQPADVSRNPFARRNESHKVIQKSESFFDKVDAAESNGVKAKRSVKGKEKESKDKKELGPRQTTLFGMLPKNGSLKKTNPKASEESEANEAAADSQATDIPMSDMPGSDVTLVGTQPSDWEETQLNDEEMS
ncbi:hypothetical protein CPB85DRAFT_1564580 [Mucidula mucida]|nr:hypothetical protein CPB85DRAFT_1564580 [Mucidula mucida]